MKKSFIVFVGAILLVLSSINFSVFESQKGVTNLVFGYDIVAYGVGTLLNDCTTCTLLVNPSNGCDPNDPDWPDCW